MPDIVSNISSGKFGAPWPAAVQAHFALMDNNSKPGNPMPVIMQLFQVLLKDPTADTQVMYALVMFGKVMNIVKRLRYPLDETDFTAKVAVQMAFMCGSPGLFEKKVYKKFAGALPEWCKCHRV